MVLAVNTVAPRVDTGGWPVRTQEATRSSAAQAGTAGEAGGQDEAGRRPVPLECDRIRGGDH